MMRKKLTLAILAGLSLMACSPQQSSKEETKNNASAETHEAGAAVVKIGFVAPLTGVQANYGQEYKNGVTLAIEDENASNPMINGQAVRFELVVEDDQADPKSATQVAQSLVDKKVSGVIGHFNSGTSIPASLVYNEAKLPNIAMATSPVYTSLGYAVNLRSMTSDTQQGSVIGAYVVKKLGAKKIVIIDDRTAYGQGLSDEFEKAVQLAGGSILKREFTTDKASDFSAILSGIKALSPEVVFYGGTDAQSAPMVKQMERLGLKVQFISGEMSKTSHFIKTAGSAAEGVMVSLAGVPLEKMPKGADYKARYEARFKMPVEVYSPYGYDATRVMIAAMKKANSSDAAKYLPLLAAIEYKEGVTSSNWAYDAKGDLKSGGVTVYKVTKGEWMPVETIE